jgi:hypothetical protein
MIASSSFSFSFSFSSFSWSSSSLSYSGSGSTTTVTAPWTTAAAARNRWRLHDNGFGFTMTAATPISFVHTVRDGLTLGLIDREVRPWKVRQLNAMVLNRPLAVRGPVKQKPAGCVPFFGNSVKG